MQKQQKRDEFKKLRASTGLSQGRLAKLMGMGSRQRVCEIEIGAQDRSPTGQQMRHVEAVAFIVRCGRLEEYLESIERGCESLGKK